MARIDVTLAVGLALAVSACGGATEVAAGSGSSDPDPPGSTGDVAGSSGGAEATSMATTTAPPDPDGSTGEGAEPATCEAPPVCEATEDRIACPRQTLEYRTGVTGLTDREVHWQTPACPAPAQGYPAVVMFQGSLFTSELNWVGLRDAPLGMWEQVSVLSNLLDAGFVVITPEAHVEGATFWDTNIPPFSLAWETSSDHRLMLEIFAGIEAGDFGPVDTTRLFATGISSGGYMTSRMAVSYPGRFRALAIAAASYAVCGGPACLLPDELPADHPPTLFLHGGSDDIVPVNTMTPYAEALEAQGTDVRVVVDPDAGHEWIDPSPGEVLQWMQDHL